MLFFSLFLTLLTPGWASADTSVTFDVSENGKVVANATLLISDNKMRLERSDGLRTFMIFDNNSETFYAVNPIKRSYTVMDKAALDQVVHTINQAQIQMFKALQNISPAQRKQMEAMMKKMMPQQEAKKDISYKSTGKKAKVNGNNCKITKALVNGNVRSEICLTTPASIGLSKKDANTLFGFQAHILKLVKTIPGMKEEDSYWGDPALEQFPLRMTVIKDGAKVKVNEISKISFDALDKELFKVPSNYTQQDVGLGL